MPTASRWKATDPAGRRRLDIIVGHNLPFLLWTALAGARNVWEGDMWACPTKAVVGWCPACGLTAAYSRLLAGGGVDSPMLVVVLAGFVANLAWSVRKAFSAGNSPTGRGIDDR